MHYNNSIIRENVKMKKALMTFVAASCALNAFSATTTNINASNISMTATPTTTFSNILKDTSASLATGFERTSINNDKTTGYLNLNLNKKFNEDISATLQIRSNTDNVNDTNNNPYAMIDPRIFINAYNTEFNTALGAITVAPQLRIQPHTNGNTHKGANKGDLATLRLGATASMNTTTANSIAMSAFVYDHLVDGAAGNNVKDDSHFYFIFNDSYALNDHNSLSVTFEHFTNIDQAQRIYRSVDAQNDVTFTYSNTSIKNLMIAPYISQDLKRTAAANLLELGVDLRYNF